MKISELINQRLFDPKNGYYKNKNPLGKNSDFITAPEVSQIFGETLSVYILSQFSQFKSSKIILVEMGAGTGTFYFDIVNSISKLAQKNNSLALEFLKKTQFHIIEINPILQQIQRQKLANFKIIWHDNFENFSQKISDISSPDLPNIFFISNELLDCFAIDQYVKIDIGWCERLVRFEDEKTLKNPQFFLDNFDVQKNNFVLQKLGLDFFSQAPIGAVFEHSKDAENFMHKLCETLKKLGGMAINIDYGYINHQFANTLQCIKNHQKIAFLEGFFDSDITAHVDFLMLEKIVKKFALESSLVSQKDFLLSLGAQERAQDLIAKNPQQSAEIKSALNRLISPQEMGELFKVHISWNLG